MIAVSRRTDVGELRTILGNPEMIAAYKSGIPGNGRPFPRRRQDREDRLGRNTEAPSSPAAWEPGELRRVEYIIKDANRSLPATNGWGYARFVYDPKVSVFSPWAADNPDFAQQCHPMPHYCEGQRFHLHELPRKDDRIIRY